MHAGTGMGVLGLLPADRLVAGGRAWCRPPSGSVDWHTRCLLGLRVLGARYFKLLRMKCAWAAECASPFLDLRRLNGEPDCLAALEAAALDHTLANDAVSNSDP